MAALPSVFPQTEAAVLSVVTFEVYGEAQPGGSKRAFHNEKTGRTQVVDANKNAKPWQAAVRSAAAEAMRGRPLLEGPLRAKFTFYRPRPSTHFGTGRNASKVRDSAPSYPITRPDALKLARIVEDSLSGIVFRDDAQIVEEYLCKLYGEPARAWIFICQMEKS